jgi:hypothetical protein
VSGRRLGRAHLDYDDVVAVDGLPGEWTSDGAVVRRGYAAQIGDGLWFFFESLLPALAFGRAARMSYQCSQYAVFEAAHEVRFDLGRRKDVRTLYVVTKNLDRGSGEREQLQRWADGVNPRSAHWSGPER